MCVCMYVCMYVFIYVCTVMAITNMYCMYVYLSDNIYANMLDSDENVCTM